MGLGKKNFDCWTNGDYCQFVYSCLVLSIGTYSYSRVNWQSLNEQTWLHPPARGFETGISCTEFGYPKAKPSGRR